MYYGFDIGGSKIALGVFNQERRLQWEKRVATPKSSYEDFLQAVEALVREADERFDQQGSVGIGIPGMPETADGTLYAANGTVTEMRAGPAEGALEMLCGEFYFGPHVSWLFSEASTLIHLHTDAREDCPELDALLNILVRESLAQRPGGSAIVRSLGDTLLVLLLRMLLGEQQPPGGLLRLMSDERLMPAVLAVMATPEQPWTLESMAARAFLSRATFARHFARVYHLTPQAWLSQLRMALAARLLRLERQTNLEVIAERCGFQSLASFSKRFKMRYGVTPGEWRRG